MKDTALHHHKENTVVNKHKSKVERDAFKWLLHNIHNLKEPSSPLGIIIPTSTPKMLLQLTRIIHDKHNSVSLAKRYKMYLFFLKAIFLQSVRLVSPNKLNYKLFQGILLSNSNQSPFYIYCSKILCKKEHKI